MPVQGYTAPSINRLISAATTEDPAEDRLGVKKSAIIIDSHISFNMET